MAKKCDCHGVVEMLERDPRLRALPLAPRMLWFALVRAMQSLSVSVLRFGDAVPDAREIAMMVGIAESELEANLQPILARGLLEREADGALASPMLKGMIARSEINRANGLRGGATRRAQAEARRSQRELVLPIAGGQDDAGQSGESEREANPPVSVPLAKLKLESTGSSSAKLAVSDDEFHRVGREALNAMGIDPAKSMATYGIVKQWLADGATAAVILATIQAKARPGIKHLGYFTEAIRDAMAREVAADAATPSPRFVAWEQAVEVWRASGKVASIPLLEEFAANGTRVAA